MGGDYGSRPTGPQVTSNQHAAAYGLLRFYEQQRMATSGGTPCSSNSSEICVDEGLPPTQISPTCTQPQNTQPTQLPAIEYNLPTEQKHETSMNATVAVNPVVLHDSTMNHQIKQESQMTDQVPPTQTFVSGISRDESSIIQNHAFKSEAGYGQVV